MFGFQGLLFLLCALSEPDVSKVRVGKLSPYGIETLRNIFDFLDIRFDIMPDPSTGTVILRCVGCGYKNLSRKLSWLFTIDIPQGCPASTGKGWYSYGFQSPVVLKFWCSFVSWVNRDKSSGLQNLLVRVHYYCKGDERPFSTMYLQMIIKCSRLS